MKSILRLCLALVFLCWHAAMSHAATNLGLFTDHTDVGTVAQAGTVQYQPADGVYQVTGGGENIWSTNDAFHFVWKKLTGEVALTAEIRFAGTNGNPHRKACLMLRQSLAADAVYADVALHASGLTALQYRAAPGAPTTEIQSDLAAPERLRLEKRGDYVALFLASAGGAWQPAGQLRLPFAAPFYAGLAVCAHDNQTNAQARFSNVELVTLPPAAQVAPALASVLEVVSLADGRRRVVYQTTNHLEAPNWSRDGSYFLFNGGGKIFKLPVTGGAPQPLTLRPDVKCNNDHGLSPDGTQLVVSGEAAPGEGSRIYRLPVAGGAAQLITPRAPSYWHGWSPDGGTLAYCAARNGQFDVYTIPAAGGEETRLTDTPGLDDGPEYSPDGKHIYFNSDRTGRMQIWRMKADGSEQTQITTDDYNNWFAHPSPDGQWLVLLSYPKEVTGHPPGKDVSLRLLALADGNVQVLATFFGGQGTINVPSWSPDSKSLAFVSYQRIYP